MKNIIKIRADIVILIVCFIYVIATSMLLMDDGIANETGTGLDTQRLFIGVMAALMTFVVYYFYEVLYSFVFYRLKNDLYMFGIGVVVIVGYLSFLIRYLFVGMPFDTLIRNSKALNEGFADISAIVAVLIVLTVTSIIFGHTLGETIYRLALMYVLAIGNFMVILYFNPLKFEPRVLLLVLNVFMIYLTLRQLVRCRGLVALNRHSN